MSMKPVSQDAQQLQQWRKTLNDDLVRSPYFPMDIPDETPAATIMAALRVHSRKHPEKAAIIDAADNTQAMGYAEIHDKAQAFAGFLHAKGLRAGDSVTAVLVNSVKWPVFALGVWTAGGVAIGCNAGNKMHDLVYQLSDSQTFAVLTSEDLLDKVMAAVQQCPTIKLVICIRTTPATVSALPQGVIDFEQALTSHSQLTTPVPVSMDDPCMITYTSGTTGLPKGVVHTNRTIQHQVQLIPNHWDREFYGVLSSEPVDWYQEHQFITVSLFHLLGIILGAAYLIKGAPIIVMKTFDGPLYARQIAKFKPRIMLVSPPILAYFAKDPEGKKADLSSIKVLIITTSPLRYGLCTEFVAHHPLVKYLVQVYGMSEIGNCLLPMLLEKGIEESCGIIAPYLEQRVVCPTTGSVLGNGCTGELHVRGLSVTPGYHNRPEETAKLIDGDGWISTGDIAFIDARGCTHIVDRSKEMIKVDYKSATIQVAPAEIEGVLISNTRIKDAAVIGVQAEICNELIRAFVVKEDEGMNEEDVENCVAEKLADHKRITGGVFFVDRIPRSLNGKILRKNLRALGDLNCNTEKQTTGRPLQPLILQQ